MTRQGTMLRPGAAALRFTFDGRALSGLEGDTLASALLANGVHLVGRSFKYHRPRGILSAGHEEPNALVEVGQGARRTPNTRATMLPLAEGLVATSQNRTPSLARDLGAVNDGIGRLLPAGFYYKTFMWPARAWMGYERLIRRAAGLGRAPTEPDPDLYDRVHAHADVLVAGGGPAGLTAALEAAQAGEDVILADERPRLGGTALDRSAKIEGRPALEWLAETEATLRALPNVRILTGATVTGAYDHNLFTIVQPLPPPPDDAPFVRERLTLLRTRRAVLATGAIERPLVFPGNDRPGVMLCSAIAAYARRYGVAAGRNALLFTSVDAGYEAALALLAQGVPVTVADARRDPAGKLAQAAIAAGAMVLADHVVAGTSGRLRIDGALLRSGDGRERRVACDLLGMSGGWNPNVSLYAQAGGRPVYDAALATWVPGAALPAISSVGACAGGGAEQAALWSVAGKGKAFVDFQNDVTAGDVALAAREGYRSVEHLKRYTTTGMGTDQGKTSNVNAIGLLSQSLGRPIPEIGTTGFRPPTVPVTMGLLAGRTFGPLFDPDRRTPMHERQVAAGALFEDVGQWKRAWYYPRSGERMQDAVNREVRTVRQAAGLLDASTLGKIDVQGPDAVTLLQRVYSNDWAKLKPGRCRYGLMLDETGMVMDDGVTTRLADDRFFMTTTTGNAARVLAWLEEWLQTEWTDLKVRLTSQTEHFAVATLAGPKAREILGALADFDVSGEAFPHLSLRTGKVAGIPARVFRISFTGEVSYEINVPARHGTDLWDALLRAGAPHGIAPYGTEAMHVLRADKGYVIIGQETDGTTTPDDLGMGWAVSKSKDFLGRRSLARADTKRPDRKQLVGLLTDDPAAVAPEGAQIVEQDTGRVPMPMIGHVTSSYWSESIGRSIALALVQGGRDRIGGKVTLKALDRALTATVTQPVFYDPDNERLA